jgi:Flp pilus assembly protein TadG
VTATRRAVGRTAAAGLAALEFALLLPMLVLLGLMVIDFARALQAQLILINITREGASLAARASPYQTQTIMNSLAATTPPLDMPGNGMIYITEVMGKRENDGSISNVVVNQYRWLGGGAYSPPSAAWSCGSWTAGKCTVPNPAPTANVMTGHLADGELIYAVEAFYRFSMFFGPRTLGSGITTPQIGPDLQAITVM